MVPALVLVAVAVLALALLTGHVLKFGPLTRGPAQDAQGISSVAPQLPLAAVALDTYPGQDQRGVFQRIDRIVASGNTMVTMGSQRPVTACPPAVPRLDQRRAHLAPGPGQRLGGGRAQAALGHPATLLAGGPGGWVAFGHNAIWTSPNGQSWTLAGTRGITPQLHSDTVYVVTKTADGFLAAGYETTGAGNQAVIWTSRDGVTWQRLTAAQLGPGRARGNRAEHRLRRPRTGTPR